MNPVVTESITNDNDFSNSGVAVSRGMKNGWFDPSSEVIGDYYGGHEILRSRTEANKTWGG